MGRRNFRAPRCREERLVEKAGGADKDVGNIRVALGSFEVPAAVGKPHRDDLLFEADEFGEPAVTRNLLDVRPDLVGRRIFARPVVVGLERKLVLTGQNVDKETGKGVVPPGPADFTGLFVNGEINARALQGLGMNRPETPAPATTTRNSRSAIKP